VDTTLAATCFKENVILITNDNDFKKVKEEGIIKIWSVSEAIRNLMRDFDG